MSFRGLIEANLSAAVERIQISSSILGYERTFISQPGVRADYDDSLPGKVDLRIR